MQVTILIPTRNGAEFLEWSYNSIRKNQGNHDVEILIFNDNSYKDNTNELLQGLMEKDSKLTVFSNTGERKGISGAYTFLSRQVKTKYLMHFHNDMYLCEGSLDLIEKQFIEHGEKIAVCLTRIEHSMGYQPGPEKIIWDNAPLELEDWNEELFINDLPKLKSKWNDNYTGGHFAPFCMNTDEYHSLGGVDDVVFPLQSREDSDWAFRLVLADFKTIQIPAFVFHFASRGNRRNKYETNTLIDNPEWVEHNIKATRNFIRKWGTLNLHDKYLKPYKPKLYNIGIVFVNTKISKEIKALLQIIELYCSDIYIKSNIWSIRSKQSYIETEQSNTIFDLDRKIHLYSEENSKDVKIDNDIIITVNENLFDGGDMNIIQNINDIITSIIDNVGNNRKTSVYYKLGTMAIEIKPTAINLANKLIHKDSLFLSNKYLVD